jgi:hypothetical protein
MPLAIDDPRRQIAADAECIAEQGARDFLGEVAPYLRHAGVPIEVEYAPMKCKARPELGLPARIATPMFDADGWFDPPDQSCRVANMRVALAPGEPFVDITESEPGGPDYSLFVGDRELVIYTGEESEEYSWCPATRVVVRLIDELLAAHGSSERVYVAEYGENDQHVYFLASGMARPRERLLASTEL